MLDALIPLYPTFCSSIQIRSLVLRILPTYTSYYIIQHAAQKITSHIVHPIIPLFHNTKCTSINTQCVSSYFTLQLLPAID